MEEITEVLINYFGQEDFEISSDVPEQLTYTPEIILSKGDEYIFLHLKEDSNNIRASIIQRIAQAKKIPSKEYTQYLVFNEKPKMGILKDCKLFGLGIFYLNKKGDFEVYAEPKRIKGRIKKTQIPNTKIFFSSKQDLEERKVAKDTIDVHRDAHKIPLFAMLVEDDQRYENDTDILLDIINECMDDSDYVLCILGEEYRAIVDQEIRRALDLYNTEEIMIFLKNNKESKESWATLLTHIQTDYKVKYTEFLDTSDFRRKFLHRFMVVVKALHKKHDVEFL